MAYSSSLLRVIIARNQLSFFKSFQILYIFAQVFKYFVFLPFLNIFCPFYEKLHACLYFVEYALNRVQIVDRKMWSLV